MDFGKFVVLAGSPTCVYTYFMGKLSKRKQTVVAFETSSDAVPVQILSFPSNLKDGEGIEKLVAKFFQRLSTSKDLKTQVSCIQETKGDVKTALNSIDIRSASSAFSALLTLYLSPDSTALRKSLDWIVDFIAKSESRVDLVDIIISVCSKIMDDIDTSIRTKLSAQFGFVTIDRLLSFAFSLECMAAIDKETGWLTTNGEIDLSDNIMLRYISLTVDLFGVCATFVCPELALSTNKASAATDVTINVGSAEVMRYAECCGLCMRVVMTVLKVCKILFIVVIIPE